MRYGQIDEPLPKMKVHASLAKRIDEKREAAKRFLGDKWLGVVKPEKKRLTARQKKAKDNVIRRFTGNKRPGGQ